MGWLGEFFLEIVICLGFGNDPRLLEFHVYFEVIFMRIVVCVSFWGVSASKTRPFKTTTSPSDVPIQDLKIGLLIPGMTICDEQSLIKFLKNLLTTLK